MFSVYLQASLFFTTLFLGARTAPLDYQPFSNHSNHTMATRKWCPVDSQYCCHRLYDHQRTRERTLLRDYLGVNIPFDDHLVGVRCNPMQALLGTGEKCHTPIVCCAGGHEYLNLVKTYCSPMESDDLRI